jgi:hypothetical protein
MRVEKRKIQVELHHTDDLAEVGIYLYTEDGSPLSGQDIIEAVAEALLLKYDNYDLESTPELDS